MKKIIIFLFISNLCCSQETISSFDSDLDFNSIFQDDKTGNFKGTVNGVLFLQKYDSSNIILDFQGSTSKSTTTGLAGGLVTPERGYYPLS